MIKVLIADDQQMFVDGMKAVLMTQPDIEIVGEAFDGDEVLEILEEKDVDVAVLDIEMPGLDGIETSKVILKKFPKTKVLILSMYDKKEFIVNLMRVGVSGYILKNKSKEELIGAIHNIHNGNAHFGLEVLNKIPRRMDLEEKEEVELSAREKEVLCLIAEGMTAKQIAEKLFIAVATVNTHRRSLLNKLEVPNDKHLVRYAIKKKFIEL